MQSFLKNKNFNYIIYYIFNKKEYYTNNYLETLENSLKN